jgi:hypothetical protein
MLTYAIWYMRPEYFRNGIRGFDWNQKRNTLPDPNNLKKTHVFLMNIEASSLEQVFRRMQGEMWSPNGEARELIEEKGLLHTSMSVGDIAVASYGAVCMADRFGFQTLHDPSLS